MKSLFFTLLTLFSTLTFGQQKPIVDNINKTMRTETYRRVKYQTDSIRFTIVGQNDTVLINTFYLNGQLEYQCWPDDSIYHFDKLGRLKDKIYFSKAEKNQKRTEISYYANQKIQRIKTHQQSDEASWHYDETGVLTVHIEKKQITPSPKNRDASTVFYTVCYDGQNRKRLSQRKIAGYVYRNDSTTLYLDTAFYETGRIQKTQSSIKNKVLTFVEFNPYGQKIVPFIPDSLRLVPFKDNYNCYYGLKNDRDDTLFSPRFDNVLPLNHDDLFAVQIGDKVQLWRQDGKQLSTNSMQGLSNLERSWHKMHNRINSEWSENNYTDKNIFENDRATEGRSDAFFNFKSDTGNGIINAEGKVVMPPQYPPFYAVDKGYKYFAYTKVTHSYQSRHSKTIDLSGKILFNDRYPYVAMSPIQGYFYTANQENIEDKTQFARHGLVDSTGTEILPNLYKSITPFAGNTSNLVWVDLGKEGRGSYGEKKLITERSGIFNIKTRKWHIPLNILIHKEYDDDRSNFVARQLDTQKYGLIDEKGATVLPFIYDSLYLGDKKDYYILIKNGNYQFYSIEKKTFSANYAFLQHLDIDHSLRKPYPSYFTVKRGDKWGIIDNQETVIAPFEYDYAAEERGYGDATSLVLVKNNEVLIYEFYAFPKPLPKPFVVKENEQFQNFSLVDKPNRFCLVDMKTGRVVLPPQYETLNIDENSYRNNGRYRIVEAEKGKRKILFANETELIDYPFDLFPKHISGSKNLMLFKTEKAMQIAHLRQGKILRTVTEGGIAIGSDTLDNYFISEIPPIEKEINNYSWTLRDTLSQHDRNWIWLDVNGKRLSTDTFRYPLRFERGLGVGMVGDKYGIWREDGSVFAPPQYESIQYNSDERQFYLFQNIGLKNWLVMMDLSGKILVNTGFYDGITSFYTDYALVSLDGKIGLIDTNGREIIAPIIMENSTVNFLDSLDYTARYDKLKGKKTEIPDEYFFYSNPLPVSTSNYKGIKVFDFDTFPYLAQNRNLVFNILLKPQLPYILQTANDKSIYRAYKRVQSHSTDFGRGCGNGIARNGNIRFPSFSDKAISFTTTKTGQSDSDIDYINYRRRNGAWQQVRINEVLNLTMDNPLKINDLLGKKIQTLKDEDIDCGLAASFLDRSVDKALLTERGINFYFSGKNRYNWSIPVELTWEELKPFLK